jgi:hypothetical protein
VFQAIGRFRKEARDAINRLIAFLDKTDESADPAFALSGTEFQSVVAGD